MEKLTMEKIVNISKQYGFIFQGSEIYDGLANTWDYGPLGSRIKNAIKDAWRKRFIQENDNSYEIAKLIMNNLDRVGISRNRGVRSGSMTSEDKDYVVNGKSCMPSVLLEMGFMSSPTDNRLFKQNLEGYAKAIAEAVLQWSETQPY